MEKLRQIFIQEFNVNHLTLDLLDELEKVNQAKAKEFLIELFKREFATFDEKTLEYSSDIPF